MPPSVRIRQLDFLHDLFALRDEASLAEHLVARLRDLVPGDNVLVGINRPAAREALQVRLAHPFSAPDFTEVLNASGVAKNHPIWEPSPGDPFGTKVLSLMLSRTGWHEHPLYRELLRFDAVEDFVTLDFPVDSQLSLMIGVLRSRRGFRDSDVETLRQIGPHCQQAFQNAGLFARLNQQNVPGGALRVITENSQLPPLFRSRMDTWAQILGSDPGSLQPGFLTWATGQLALLRRGVLDSALAPFEASGPRGQLRLRWARNWQGPGQLLLEEANRPSAGLTPRERELLHWVREGKTNEEIAIILGLRLHSVKSYLKEIFRKLGAKSRTEAARLYSDG